MSVSKKNCEVCGNILFLNKNVCVSCKQWGPMLKAFHKTHVNPAKIADYVYEYLVHKFENEDFYYDDNRSSIKYQIDDELIETIQQFTYWRQP